MTDTETPGVGDGGGSGAAVAPTDVLDGEGDDPVQRARELGRLLDSAFRVPGTNFRIGVDPLAGLLPYLGDATMAVFSAYIVAVAVAEGASRATVARMLGNLALDATLGSVPVVGDLFDAWWKANERNVDLLEARLAEPSTARRDRLLVGVTLVGALLFVLALLAVTAVGLAFAARELAALL